MAEQIQKFHQYRRPEDVDPQFRLQREIDAAQHLAQIDENVELILGRIDTDLTDSVENPS